MNSELPDDIEQLKAMLRKQQSRLRQMLFGQSSEKKRYKLENRIRQAEKRLNTARNLLEDASSVTDLPDPRSLSENPGTSKPESPRRKSSRKGAGYWPGEYADRNRAVANQRLTGSNAWWK